MSPLELHRNLSDDKLAVDVAKDSNSTLTLYLRKDVTHSRLSNSFIIRQVIGTLAEESRESSVSSYQVRYRSGKGSWDISLLPISEG